MHASSRSLSRSAERTVTGGLALRPRSERVREQGKGELEEKGKRDWWLERGESGGRGEEVRDEERGTRRGK